MNKLQFWKQYWWFWALAVGVPTTAVLGYLYLRDEGYIGGEYPDFGEYDFDDIEIGAYR